MLLFVCSYVCYAETIGQFQVKDGVATDSATDLMWIRCPLGMKWGKGLCQDDVILYNWEEALKKSKGFSYAKYSDWRLPTSDELKTLIDKTSGNFNAGTPYINSLVFPRTQCNNSTGYSCTVWSSSPYAWNSHLAWLVDFSDGSASVGYKYLRYAVRLVRGEQ